MNDNWYKSWTRWIMVWCGATIVTLIMQIVLLFRLAGE